ncbi:MAG TPA: hypothetical protein PKH07_20585, partial [bacterium]|nr:hypothetical protein [bacterium]
MTAKYMIRMCLCVVLFLSAFPILSMAKQPSLRAKAGAYYFEGWTGKTFHLTERLKNEFFDREPVWGWNDDSRRIMEKQIKYAADNGLSFFAFDWYYPEEENKETPLNNGLEHYLRARSRKRMEFCLLVANHAGFRIGPKEWDIVSEKWIELFKQPTHLKVNGKPLLIFFAPNELYKAFGGPEGVKQAFDSLRSRAVEAGLPGVMIAACTVPGPDDNRDILTGLEASGYDLLTGYNYHGHPARPGAPNLRPFAEMVEGHIGVYDRFAAKAKLPYIPVITVGWDKRPWEEYGLPEESQSVYYPDTTPHHRQLSHHPPGGPLDRPL